MTGGRDLGDGYVSVRPDTDGFAAEAERGLSPGLKKLAGAVVGALASKAAYNGAKALADRASNLNETVNKSQVIFGGASKALERFASKGSERLGQTQQQALDAAATFGIFGKAAGLTNRENGKFSKGLVKLATDMASFSNKSPQQAIDALGAGLRGETEPLRDFGVLLNESTLRQEALRQGLVKTTTQALTPQQRVLAAHAVILKQTKDAQGDFARTGDGFANVQRKVTAQVDNLKTKLGQGLLPIFAAGGRLLNEKVLPPLIGLADRWVPKASRALAHLIDGADISGWAKSAADAFKKFDVSKFLAGAGDGASKLGDALSKVDLSKLGDALGNGVNDTLSVFSVVVGFAADHVDTLAKYLPLLITAFIAYKGAQAAANLVSLASVPITAGQVVANLALASAMRGYTAQLILQNGTERVTMLTRIRATVVTVASTTASLAAAAATKVMAAGQWLLNAALTANPIGLVVAAVAGLIGGFVLLYKHSETFRGAVDTLWNSALKPLAQFIGGVLLGYVKLLAKGWLMMARFGVQAFTWLLKAAFATFDGILSAAEKGLGWVPRLGDKIRGARAAFNDFGDATIHKLEAVSAKLKEASAKVDELGRKKPVIDVTIVYHHQGTANVRDPSRDLIPNRPRSVRPPGRKVGDLSSTRSRGTQPVMRIIIDDWATGLGHIVDGRVDDHDAWAATTGAY